jgi:cystathionine beta-lyase/cystathionine gamma-synthase
MPNDSNRPHDPQASPRPRPPQRPRDLNRLRRLSPKRNSTQAQSVDQLVDEQLRHFGIDSASEFGRHLGEVARHIYESGDELGELWRITAETVQSLDRSDRIAYFNAKKFLSFQLAKLLDTLQNPFRKSYQALGYSGETIASKGPYAIFDNVAAIFAANPVITRTATYIYACAEWIQDAFQGRELLLDVYSRLLNPTSIALANHVVDLEAGPYADQYFAWNFSSGMAAIDAALSHLLGRDDMLITSRNIYGGAHQLIHDWFAKPANLDIAVESFDGSGGEDFVRGFDRAKQKFADRFRAGRQAYLYLESPSNPHGEVLDVPAICREAHRLGLRVILDATIGTPFLVRPLQRTDPAERPDFVIHSYTKDLSGAGAVIAGVVIARNEDMFIPKGEKLAGRDWSETLFWNVYYVKGAFLNADAAFDVLTGMRTLDVRMLDKCINTLVLAQFLNAHRDIQLAGSVAPDSANAKLRQRLMFLGLPAPLFTIDMPTVPREAFQRFFDSLAPTFDHMISLGQSNTIVSCPAFTTHSELDEASQRAAGITPTTIRFAVGDEDPRDLIAHFIAATKLAIDPVVPGFSARFPTPEVIDRMLRETYLDVHRRYIESKPAFRL